MAKQLTQFTITSEGDDYLISIETDDGETFEVSTSYERLDLISEAIEHQLDKDDDEALEVEETD